MKLFFFFPSLDLLPQIEEVKYLRVLVSDWSSIYSAIDAPVCFIEGQSECKAIH